jgi:hypothetical protein
VWAAAAVSSDHLKSFLKYLVFPVTLAGYEHYGRFQVRKEDEYTAQKYIFLILEDFYFHALGSLVVLSFPLPLV